VLRVVQGATVIAMGLIAGPIGVLVAYLACYLAHGASNPMHSTLLHREVDGPRRTTLLSINSMVAQPAGAIGGIVLAGVADASSISLAMIVGGVICAVAAPLYIPAWRAERARQAAAAASLTATDAVVTDGPDDAMAA
jgi:ABC-type antimicrobial peptide transport system permease subunit